MKFEDFQQLGLNESPSKKQSESPSKNPGLRAQNCRVSVLKSGSPSNTIFFKKMGFFWGDIFYTFWWYAVCPSMVNHKLDTRLNTSSALAWEQLNCPRVIARYSFIHTTLIYRCTQKRFNNISALSCSFCSLIKYLHPRASTHTRAHTYIHTHTRARGTASIKARFYYINRRVETINK